MIFEKSTLNLISLVNGITALLIVIFTIVFALIIMYKSKKSNAKLLFYASFVSLFIGLNWLGPSLDFLSVVLIGQNLNPVGLFALLSYMWVPPAIALTLYISSKTLIPSSTKFVISLGVILGIIYEILLFLDFFIPELFPKPAFEYFIIGGLIVVKLEYSHPIFILNSIFLLFVFLIGLGGIIKASQTSGIVKKKSIELSISFFIFIIIVLMHNFSYASYSYLGPGVLLIIARILMIACAFLLYLSFKPEKNP